MSPVGHSLIGLSLAILAIPSKSSRRWQFCVPCAFVALASLPDWSILGFRYEIRHSVYVNSALIIIVIALWSCLLRLRSSIPLRCMLLGAMAWLSHLFLDSLYSHGRGVPIYWPFSDGRLNLALPWFNTLDVSQSRLAHHNLSVYGVEFIAFLPVLILAVTVSFFLRRRSRVRERSKAR